MSTKTLGNQSGGYVVTSIRSLKDRRWQVEATWTGWRRLLSLGLTVNVVNVCCTVWLLGWDIRFGRLPVKTMSEITPIPGLSRREGSDD